MKYVRLLTPLSVVVAVACGPADNDPGPGGITVGEARALDEAAEMLDDQNFKPAEVQKPAEQPATQADTQTDVPGDAP